MFYFTSDWTKLEERIKFQNFRFLRFLMFNLTSHTLNLTSCEIIYCVSHMDTFPKNLNEKP